MKLYNCVTELEKELQAIDLARMNAPSKGLLTKKIYEGHLVGEFSDPEVVINALTQIALSLVPIPIMAIDVIDGKEILMSYPAGEKVFYLALWRNEYVTWVTYKADPKNLCYGHYFNIHDYGSHVLAYLEAYRDFQKRLFDEKASNEGLEGEPAKMPFYLET